MSLTSSKPPNADTGSNNGIALPAAPNLYNWGATVASAYSNNDIFTSFIDPSPSSFIGASFNAGTRYNNSIALPAASNPYTLEAAVAIGHANNNTFAPFIDPNLSPFTGSTFPAGAAYNGGLPFQTAPNPYTLGVAGPTANSNNNAFAPFIAPNPSPFTGSPFPAGVAYDESLSFQNAPSPYSLGGGGPTGHLNNNNNTFAPLVHPNPGPFTEATFPADAAYNSGTALPTAFMPYNWQAPAPTGPTDPFMGAGFPYPDPTLPIMSPVTAATATATAPNDYQGPLPPTTGLDTQIGATVDLAPQRPTCVQCRLSFTRKADLDRHAKIHQAGAKTFRCKVVKGCGYASLRKDKLTEHVRRRHPGVGVLRRGEGGLVGKIGEKGGTCAEFVGVVGGDWMGHSHGDVECVLVRSLE